LGREAGCGDHPTTGDSATAGRRQPGSGFLSAGARRVRGV